MKILERIKNYCASTGTTQKEFAQKAGINPVTLSKLMTGVIKNSSVLKLDAYLDEVEGATPSTTSTSGKNDDHDR